MTEQWPWPEDTRTDRAQRCARRYRDALMAEAPDVCAFLDRQYIQDWGQDWLSTTLASEVSEDDWVTVDEAAPYVGLATQTIYTWIHRDKVTPVKCNDGRIRLRLGDVLSYNATLRRRRRNASQKRRPAC